MERWNLSLISKIQSECFYLLHFLSKRDISSEDVNALLLRLKTMPMFSATLGSFTSLSFLSASQPDPSTPSSSSSSFFNRFSFPKCPHKLTAKIPWQWHHYHNTARIFVSGNTQIEENSDSGILEHPSASDPLDAAREARVCLSFLYKWFYYSF